MVPERRFLSAQSGLVMVVMVADKSMGTARRSPTISAGPIFGKEGAAGRPGALRAGKGLDRKCFRSLL